MRCRAVRILVSSMAVVATACTTGESPHSRVRPPTDPQMVSEQAWHEPTATLAPGNGIEILRTLPSHVPGGPQVLRVLEDGRLLVVDDRRLRLEDPETGETTPIDAPDTHDPGRVFAADDDGRYLAWVTTSARDLFTFPWRLYSLDLRSGTAREVARHHDVGVDPVPAAPGGTRPVLHDGRIYYAAVRRLTERGAVVPAVYSVAADGSDAPRVEVPGAYGPAILGGDLVHATSDVGFVDWTLTATSPDRPQPARVVAEGPGRRQRLSGWATDGEGYLWQEKDGPSCTLKVVTADGERSTFGTGGCGRFWAGYLHLTDRWAAFSLGSSRYRSYVSDLRTGTTYRLTEGSTYGATQGAGDIITWRPGSGPDQGRTVVGRLTLPD